MSKEIEKSEVKEWLSQEDKIIIRKQFFPENASHEDMKYCMGVAKAFNLNPILKQIYFVGRKSNTGTYDKPVWREKIEPLAGRDSFLTLAHRSGKFNGIESSVNITQVPMLNGAKWEIRDELVATCKVFVKGFDNPFIVEVNYSEYVQKTNAGKVTKFWLEKPQTMLKKVAESQCLRKAFNITGLYDESEIRNDSVELKENKQEQKQINDINKL